MADKIKFLYGSTADINTPSSSNYPAVVRGQVYFAVDQLTSSAVNGLIYFDVPVGTGTEAKRILMSNHAGFAASASTAALATTATRAINDSGGHDIAGTYLSTAISLSGHTLTFKDGNGSTNSSLTLTLPDVDEKLKVTSFSGSGTKVYLLGNTSSTLGAGNNTVTTTAVTNRDIYIDTDGFLKGNLKTKPLTFLNGTYFDGSTDVNVGNTIHYLEGTGTATTVTNYSAGYSSSIYSPRWGAIDSNNAIPNLYSGLTIAYKIPVAGNGSYITGLRITKSDGTIINRSGNTAANDGYYPVVIGANSNLSTKYGVGSIVILVFDAAQSANIYPTGKTAVSVTGCWKTVDYDTTNIYLLKSGYSNYTTATTVYRYQIMLTAGEGKILPVNTVSNSTATSKTLTTETFDPFGQIFYYSATATKNKDVAIGDSFYELILADLRYSFNTGNTLTARSPVYLVTSLPNDNGKVTLDSTPIVQTLPTTNTNKLYIYLGLAYDNYRVELMPVHPVYAFLNGKLLQVSGQSIYAGNATNAVNDGNGNNISNLYLSSAVSISGHTISFLDGNGTTVASVTVPDSDEKLKVTSTSSAGSKIFLVGNAASGLATAGSSATSTGIVHKDIYIDTSGRINATTTTALRASTATRAENDKNGKDISGTYLSTVVSISDHTISFQDGGGTTVASVTVPDSDEKLKVTSTSSVGSKIYIVGNVTSGLGTAGGTATSTGIVHKDIYIDTSGRINATTTTALLASTATRATNDINGKSIKDFYLSTTTTTANYHTTFKNGQGSDVVTVSNIDVDNNGIIALKHIPLAALERVHVVTSTADMIALTTAIVQNGDVVKVTGVGTMYYVKDDTLLNSLAGYEEFAVGKAGAVDWGNIIDIPSTAILSKTNSSVSLSTSGTTATISINLKTMDGTDGVVKDLIIPAAATNVAGLVSTGALTFKGAKTLSTATVTDLFNYSGIPIVSDNANYYLWMSSTSSTNKGKPVYATALTYNPSTKILLVTANKAKYDDTVETPTSTTPTIADKYIIYDSTAFSTGTNVWKVTNGNGTNTSFLIQNWYPASATWAASASSVTLTIKNRSLHSSAVVNSIVTATIPVATTSSAGIVTSTALTFGGLKTFNDGVTVGNAAKLSVENPNTSLHSNDSNAAVVVSGGVSVGLLLSAKSVKIDNAAGTSTAGCVMTYDSTKLVLSFNFE